MANTTQKVVMLILTENCNLSCSYCYEHFKTSRTMNFDTAKRILDYELDFEDGYTDVIIEFFGGEPFLEFNLLKDIYYYINDKAWNKNVLFFATTNGTLIHGDIQEWLHENRTKMCCGISLDGTPQMHDRNRSHSFSDINIDFFRKTWSKQTCKMTISEETLPQLAEGIFYLQEVGYEVKATFAQGIDWSKEDNLILLEHELQKLVRYYIEHKDQPLCDFLNLKLDMVHYSKASSTKWCGVGEQVKAYDINGNIYPCQAFAPQTLGLDEGNPFKGTTLDHFTDFIDEGCRECIISPICPTCYGANYQRTGDYRKRDKSLCQFNKLCTLASSYVQYQRLTSKLKLDEMTQEQYLYLSAIEKIHGSL
jgi:uncharacterized protein